MGRGMWLVWEKRNACRFVVEKTDGKLSLDDLRVGVGTTFQWFLKKYDGRMRSGFIWLIVEIERQLLLKTLMNFHVTFDAGSTAMC